VHAYWQRRRLLDKLDLNGTHWRKPEAFDDGEALFTRDSSGVFRTSFNARSRNSLAHLAGARTGLSYANTLAFAAAERRWWALTERKPKPYTVADLAREEEERVTTAAAEA